MLRLCGRAADGKGGGQVTMREKIARAMLEDINDSLPRFTAQTWEQCTDLARESLLRRADNVLRAMREPTEKSLGAMGRAWASSHYGPVRQPDDWLERDMRAVAGAMIDAALEEG